MTNNDVFPWVVIEDLSRFMINGGIKQYHPDDPRHTPYWRKLKKMCIEGLWAEDWGKMRYMPGRLFFYGNFGTLIDTDEEEKTRRKIRPLIGDIEWERAYNFLVAEGFSGWSEDDKYTSDYGITKVKKNWHSMDSDKIARFFRSDGKFKEFIAPEENVRLLQDEPKGVPLYRNGTSNIIEMGSRGGGKSYFYAIAGAQYRIVFDGIKYYTESNRKNPPTVSVLVGSGSSSKSSSFCKKIEDSMNELSLNPELGAWGERGKEGYTPSPFYKDMSGTLKPNNDQNPWIHKYSVEVGGRWIDGLGTGSHVVHVNYSPNKKIGAEAGAGGRYNDIYYEEIGLTELVIEAYNSNRATITASGDFGTQVFLGTSGNMEVVQPARKIFTHPQDYECLQFPDRWEASTNKIGFFLPAYITDRRFKDKNGNTDIQAAKEHFEERRKKAEKSDDPSVLRYERMNYPMVPSDMWQTEKGSILPVKEAEEREKELVRNNLYEKLGVAVNLYKTTSNYSGIGYDILHDAEPYFEWPLESNQARKSLEGAIVIYDFPYEKAGVVPNDMYFFTHDPYVSDEWDRGGSLGATHVWLSPKYWDTHMPTTGPLVATYIGKAANGKREYYKNQEKLWQFYGSPNRAIAYEANRGEYCRSYYIKNNPSALALRPSYQTSQSIYQKPITQYGYMVGNRIAKIELLDDFADMLLQEIDLNGEKKLVIETIPCIFTIRQIKTFDLENNFDAVDSACLAPLYMHELEHTLLEEKKKKQQGRNPLAFFANNEKLFTDATY